MKYIDLEWHQRKKLLGIIGTSVENDPCEDTAEAVKDATSTVVETKMVEDTVTDIATDIVQRQTYRSWFNNGATLRTICEFNNLSESEYIQVAEALESGRPADVLKDISSLSSEMIGLICFACGFGRI